MDAKKCTPWITCALLIFSCPTLLFAANSFDDKVESFCIKNAVDQRIQSYSGFSVSPENIDEAIKLELSDPEKVTATLEEGTILFPWETTQIPLMAVRQLAYQSLLNDTTSRVNNYRLSAPDLNSEEALWDYLKKAPIGNSNSFEKNFDEDFKPVDQEKIQQGLAQNLAICATYGLGFNTLSCAQELTQVLKDFQPYKASYGNTKLNAIAYVKNFMKNPIHEQAMRSLAVKMNEKIKAARAQKVIVGSDLYSDLYQTYFAITNDKTKAEDLTWEVLTVFGSRGPNFELLSLMDESYLPQLVSASIVFTAATELDIHYRRNLKRMYSFPKEVASTCDTGKSYHFWMPASIARTVLKRTGKKDVARAVSNIISVGYQMRGNVLSRNADRAFTVAWNEAGNQKIRMDLAYAAIGSMYGSKFNGASGLNINKALEIILNKSKALPPLTEEQSKNQWTGTGYEGFSRWEDLFAPTSPF